MSLSTIAQHVLRHATGNGPTNTIIQGVTLFRIHSSLIARSGVLRPSVCVVIQGEKIAHAGDAVIRYRAGDFLVSSIDMPVAGQPVGASIAMPYLAVGIELEPHEVLTAASIAGIRIANEDAPALFVGRSDENLLDVVLRTVRALDDEREARVLAPLLRSELAYRLVTGPCAREVVQSAALARAEGGVGRVLSWLATHFTQDVSVDELAALAGTSTSTLHKKFKATVRMGPLQYQKRLRLEEARRLLLAGTDVSRAAFAVGYESPSQLSREYRREFGLPPTRDVHRLRRDGIGQERSTSRQDARRTTT